MKGDRTDGGETDLILTTLHLARCTHLTGPKATILHAYPKMSDLVQACKKCQEFGYKTGALDPQDPRCRWSLLTFARDDEPSIGQDFYALPCDAARVRSRDRRSAVLPLSVCLRQNRDYVTAMCHTCGDPAKTGRYRPPTLCTASREWAALGHVRYRALVIEESPWTKQGAAQARVLAWGHARESSVGE